MDKKLIGAVIGGAILMLLIGLGAGYFVFRNGGNVDPVVPIVNFQSELQKAYTIETSVKKTNLAKLQKLFSDYSGNIQTNMMEIKTSAELLNKMKTDAKGLIGDDLMSLRELIRIELDKTLPTTNVQLDAATRKLCSDEFGKIATALSKIK